MVTSFEVDRVDLPDMSPLIRRLARGIKARHWSPIDDVADYEQELWLRLLQAWPHFDPLRGPAVSFATTILARAAAGLLRQRRAKKRRSHRACVNHPDSDRQPDIEMVPCEPDIEHRDRELDLESILGTLPPDDRQIAILLTQFSLSQVARDLGLPRSTLQRRLGSFARDVRQLSSYGHLSPAPKNYSGDDHD